MKKKLAKAASLTRFVRSAFASAVCAGLQIAAAAIDIQNILPTGDYRYTYYHNDHLGTPQRLSDKAGNLLWSAQYDAYGKAIVQTAASAQLATVNPLRQPGQYFDIETGLHYNDRRYYDADTGRYQSRDPIGFEGGINLYSRLAYARIRKQLFAFS